MKSPTGYERISENEELAILLIEQRSTDAERFEECLLESGQKARLCRESSLEAALSTRRERSPDVVVLGLPAEAEAEVMEAMQAALSDVPLVVLTGPGDWEAVPEAQKADVAEDLDKANLTPEVLGRTLRWAVERARLRGKLRRRDDRFGSIAENVSDGIYRSAPGEGLVFANQAFAEMFGYDSAEEVLEADPAELYAESDQRERLREVSRDQGGFEAREVEFRRKDGTQFTGLLSGTVVRDEKGDVKYYDGVVTDITDRKEAERELERQNDLFAKAQDLANVGAWEYDVQADELTWTEQVYRIHELPQEEELTPTQAIEFYHPDDRPKIEEVFTEAVEDGTSYEIEARIVTANGKERWVQTRGGPEISDGEVTRVRGSIQDITERKARERRLDAVFNHTYQFTGLIEPDGTLIEANDTALRFGDLQEEDVLGRPIWDTFWFKEKEPRQQALKDAVARAREGEFVRYEVEVQGAEEKRIIDFSLRPITDDSGEVTMIVPEGRDITERKERTQKLRSQGRQLEQIRQNITDVVWMSTPRKEEMEFISDSYEEVWGRSPEELRKEPTSFIEGIHPEDRERVVSALEVQANNPEAYSETYRVVQPGGEVRWVQDRAAGVYDESGELERIIGVATDITERRKREQAFEEREEKLRGLYEAIHHLLLAETRNEVSASILNLVNTVFGYPIVAVRYVEDGQFVPVQVSSEIPNHMPERPSFEVDGESVVAEAFRRGETTVYDDLRTYEDPFDYGEVRATAIIPIGEHGTISVADLEVGTIDDIDRRLIEILVAHAATVLDRVDRERDLIEAKEEAEEANRLKSAMLANMSHEIRTPLTAITGFAEILAEDAEGQAAEFIDRIQQSGDRLMRTLDSVLQLSTLEAGVYDMEREEVSLRTVVEETTEIFRPRAEEEGLTLESTVPQSPTVGEWNEGAVNRILENLLDNAIKFTPDGGDIEVRLSNTEREAVLTVEDTGVGISSDERSRVFDAFRQESEGLDRDYEGSGLGLAIVQRLVDVFGGDIEVESEKGEGTRFTVRLPKQRSNQN